LAAVLSFQEQDANDPAVIKFADAAFLNISKAVPRHRTPKAHFKFSMF